MLLLKRQVQTLIKQGSYTRAIGLAADFARRHPEHAASFQLVAMAEEAAGYTKAAIQTIAHAIELAPGDPSSHIMRARLLLRDKRLNEATAEVNALIALCDARRDTRFLHDAVACRDELLERVSSNRQSPRSQQATGTCSQFVV